MPLPNTVTMATHATSTWIFYQNNFLCQCTPLLGEVWGFLCIFKSSHRQWVVDLIIRSGLWSTNCGDRAFTPARKLSFTQGLCGPQSCEHQNWASYIWDTFLSAPELPDHQLNSPSFWITPKPPTLDSRTLSPRLSPHLPRKEIHVALIHIIITVYVQALHHAAFIGAHSAFFCYFILFICVLLFKYFE